MKKLNEAINICLVTIGERPLEEGVSIVGVYEAEIADVAIEEAKTELLSKGFIFNTDTEWELAPDTSDTITIPYSTLAVDATAVSPDYIAKDGKLYNKAEHSFQFTDPVKVDIIWNIEFDLLPSHAQTVVVNMAKEKVYTRIVGYDATIKLLQSETIRSYSVLTSEEMRLGSYSIFDDGSTNRPMTRGRNPIGL